MRLSAIILSVIIAQPTANPEILEPSVQNEVDHALEIAAPLLTTNGWSSAAERFARLYETNALSATDAAIRLVSTQKPDGRWLDGTNDVTAAAVYLLRRYSTLPLKPQSP